MNVNQKPRRKQTGPARRRGVAGWAIAAVAVIALGAAGLLIWIGRPQPAPADVSGSIPTAGDVIGSATAPVTVDEWGDFQ